MARADIIAAASNVSTVHFSGGGTSYLVQKNGANSTFYLFYVDGGSDVAYVKSTDGGFTWGTPVIIRAGTIAAISIWYARWSGIASDVVHVAYTDSVLHDILYRSLDISTDTLGTERTVFAGVSVAAGGALSIVAGRDGRLAVAGSIDAGAEDGAWSSTDGGVTWADVIADPSEAATQDQYFLLPGWNADTADLMLIFVDASANGLSVKRYDDSANTWTEAAIVADASFVDVVAGTNFPNVACAVDLANSRNIVIAWNAVDTLNADLKCFIITDTTITTVTDVILNSTDDQGLCALAIDTATGYWYAFYGGITGGSQTFSTAIALYYKVSTNSGSTWGSEVALTSKVTNTKWMAATPRFSSKYLVAFLDDLAVDNILVSALLPPASSIFGGSIVR